MPGPGVASRRRRRTPTRASPPRPALAETDGPRGIRRAGGVEPGDLELPVPGPLAPGEAARLLRDRPLAVGARDPAVVERERLGVAERLDRGRPEARPGPDRGRLLGP